MEVAQQLIRTVARAFYQPRQILVVDALLMHSTLWVDDLASVMSMNTKELRKLCSQLRDDKLVSIHTRQELKEGQTRPQNKDYYYIDYHAAIDAIKLRVVRLEKRVRDLYKPTQERKDWSCPRCNSEWTDFEVMPAWSGVGDPPCPRCKAPVHRNEVSAADRAGSERSSKLMEQLDKLVGGQGLLRVIDGMEIPQNDFEQANSRHKDIERSDTNPGIKWETVKDKVQNETVHGVKVEAPEVQVQFTTAQAVEQAEADLKQKGLEQQERNRLPEWHLESTINGQRTSLGEQERARLSTIESNSKADISSEDIKDAQNTTTNAYITQFYEAQMAAANDATHGDGREDEDEDEDEDDDGFVDARPPEARGSETPASSASPNTANVKRKAEESGLTSGRDSGTSTPAAAASPTKRIKLEDTTEGGVEDDDDDEAEEEDEFIDV